MASKSHTGKFHIQQNDFPSTRKLPQATTAHKFNLQLPESAFKIEQSGHTTQGNSSFEPISTMNSNQAKRQAHQALKACSPNMRNMAKTNPSGFRVENDVHQASEQDNQFYNFRSERDTISLLKKQVQRSNRSYQRKAANTPLSKKFEHIEVPPEMSFTEQRWTMNNSQLVSPTRDDANSRARRPIFDEDQLSELLMNKDMDIMKPMASRSSNQPTRRSRKQAIEQKLCKDAMK